MQDSTFRQGDSLEQLLRKVLLSFNQDVSPLNTDPALEPAPGDFAYNTSRKILDRLQDLQALATAEYRQGDSIYTVWRKILQTLNQFPGDAATAHTFPTPGDLPYTTVRKILLRLNELTAPVGAGEFYVCLDSMWVLWRKILSVASRVALAPPIPPAASDLHGAILDGVGGLKLLWTDNSTDETGFAIYRSTDGVNYSLIHTTVPDRTYYVMTGLTSQTYYFYVVAEAGGAPSNIFSVDPIYDHIPLISDPVYDGGTSLLTDITITIPNVVDPPGDVVIYESPNADLSGGQPVEVITVPGNKVGRSHTISAHAVTGITQRHVFARQRNATATVTSGDSNPVTLDDPAVGAAAAAAWAAQVQTNGGAAVSASSTAVVASFYGALLLAGLLPKLKALNLFAPDSFEAAMTPLISTWGTALWHKRNNTAIDFGGISVSKFGALCDVGTVIDPGINLNSAAGASDTDFGVSLYCDYIRTFGTTGLEFGGRAGSNYLAWRINFGGGQHFDCWNDGGASRVSSALAELYWVGFMSANRTAVGASNVYGANSNTAFSTFGTSATNTTTVRPNAAIYLGGFNDAGTITGALGNSYSFLALHLGLTSAEAQALYNAVEAARRGFQGGYVPKYDSTADVIETWKSRVELAGAAAPSAATVTALSAFWDAIVAADVEQKMLFSLPFVPDSLAAATVPLTCYIGRHIVVNTNFVDADLTVDGMLGDAATKYLNTGIIPAGGAFLNTDLGMVMYIATPTNATDTDFYVGNAAGTAYYGIQQYSGSFYTRAGASGDAAWIGPIAAPYASGYAAMTRTASNAFRLYAANTYTAHAELASNANNASDQRAGCTSPTSIFAATRAGGIVEGYSAKRLSFVAWTRGISSAQSASLASAIENYRIAIGGGHTPTVIGFETCESYAPDADLNGLNGGTNFAGAWVNTTY